MSSSFQYPVFLSLENHHCLVIGFGPVGRRKLRGLLEAAAGSVTVLDIAGMDSFPETACQLLDNKNVTFCRRPWTDDDIKKSFLVFAVTDNKEENSRIVCACSRYSVLCNVATDPQAGSFMVPARVKNGELMLAFSTGGASPLLASAWRGELEKWLEPKAVLSWFMGRLREPVLAMGYPSDANRKIFSTIASSPVSTWLAQKDIAACRAWITGNLPGIPVETLDRIFSDYVNIFA